MSEPAPYATLTEFKKSDARGGVRGFVVPAVLLVTMSELVRWLIPKPLQEGSPELPSGALAGSVENATRRATTFEPAQFSIQKERFRPR